jgi:tetratricopeptide (TPR) repeat protein
MNNRTKLILAIFIIIVSTNVYATTQKFAEEFSVDLNDVVIRIEKEVESNPKNYRLRFVLGALYFDLASVEYDASTYEIKKGNPALLEKAEHEFNEALKLKKDDSMTYYYLGHLSILKQHNIDLAIEFYKKSIKSDAINQRAHYKLHSLYLLQNKYNDATNLLENLAKIVKDDANVYHRLSLTYLFIGDYGRVIENAQKAISIKKNTESQLILASAYSKTKDYESAKKNLEDILSREPQNRTALLGLSTVLQKSGDDEKALDILKKANEYYPGDSEIMNKIKEIKK